MRAVLLALTLALGPGGSAAWAQDLVLTLPEAAPEGLAGTLKRASLVFALQDEALQDDETGGSAEEYVAAARADYRRLLTALYSEGYYGGAISIRIDGREATAIAPLNAPSRIGSVEISVTPGPAFTFGRVEVLPLPPSATLPAEFAAGAPALAGAVRSAVAAAVEAWRETGHAMAAPGDQAITADHRQSQLDVAVTILPGPELSFGRLLVEGNAAVRTERILAIANLPQGRRFSPGDLDRAARRLRQSGAFSSVSLRQADAANADGSLDIIARLAEDKPRRLSFGAEISSTEGLSLTGYWLHRNLLGGAESLRLGAEITGIAGQTGGTDYALTAAFGRMATFRNDLDFTADARLEHLDEPDYRLDQLALQTGFSREVFVEGLTLTAGPGLVTAHEVTPFRDRSYTLLTLPIEAAFDQRDDALNATSGFYIDVQLTPFYGLSGSDSGLRAFADGRLYHQLGERVVVAARAQLGALFGADLTDAPADYLFYSGGGGTVRGQPYQSLGVTVTDDFGMGAVTADLGGALFVGSQLEARVKVTEAIGAVAYVDAGLVGPDPTDWQTYDWQAGGGFGVRYNTAIGPIRLDIATPLTGDHAYKKVQVYIGIGQAF